MGAASDILADAKAPSELEVELPCQSSRAAVAPCGQKCHARPQHQRRLQQQVSSGTLKMFAATAGSFIVAFSMLPFASQHAFVSSRAAAFQPSVMPSRNNVRSIRSPLAVSATPFRPPFAYGPGAGSVSSGGQGAQVRRPPFTPNDLAAFQNQVAQFRQQQAQVATAIQRERALIAQDKERLRTAAAEVQQAKADLQREASEIRESLQQEKVRLAEERQALARQGTADSLRQNGGMPDSQTFGTSKEREELRLQAQALARERQRLQQQMEAFQAQRSSSAVGQGAAALEQAKEALSQRAASVDKASAALEQEKNNLQLREQMLREEAEKLEQVKQALSKKENRLKEEASAMFRQGRAALEEDRETLRLQAEQFDGKAAASLRKERAALEQERQRLRAEAGDLAAERDALQRRAQALRSGFSALGDDMGSNADATASSKESYDKLVTTLKIKEEQLSRQVVEFQNFKARVQKEEEIRTRRSLAKAAKPLLPLLDDFRRAEMQAPKHGGTLPHAVGAGTRSPSVAKELLAPLRRRLLRVLESDLQVTAMSNSGPGEPFNPELHEAIGLQESGTIPEDYIIEEVEKGFMAGDEVLRPAKVIVSSGPM